jgi:hypothetical protein
MKAWRMKLTGYKHMGEVINTEFQSGNLKGKTNLWDLSINGMKISTNKSNLVVDWIQIVQATLRGTKSREHGNKTRGFTKWGYQLLKKFPADWTWSQVLYGTMMWPQVKNLCCKIYLKEYRSWGHNLKIYSEGYIALCNFNVLLKIFQYYTVHIDQFNVELDDTNS